MKDETFPRYLGYFEALLADNGGTGFFVGDSVSIKVDRFGLRVLLLLLLFYSGDCVGGVITRLMTTMKRITFLRESAHLLYIEAFEGRSGGEEDGSCSN